MVLISDVLDHIGVERIYSSLNLANMKIKKIKLVRNSAQDNHFRVLHFMRNPKLIFI